MKYLRKFIISTTAASLAAFSLQAVAADAVPSTPVAKEPVAPIVNKAQEQPAKAPVATLIPADGGEAAPRARVSQISMVPRPLIAGLWGMAIPGSQCVEYYNFMENGEVVIKSAGEWTYGDYEYSLPETADSGLPILRMQIRYDNLQSDCSGNAVDQIGEIQQNYVKWTDKANIQFCGSADGAQCAVTLKKVLP